MPKSEANTYQVEGNHYSNKIQHWDFAASNGFDYFQGQITKYITRWKQKGGISDLLKARHFIEKYIEVELANRPKVNKITPDGVPPTAKISKDHEAYHGDAKMDKIFTAIKGRPPERGDVLKAIRITQVAPTLGVTMVQGTLFNVEKIDDNGVDAESSNFLEESYILWPLM